MGLELLHFKQASSDVDTLGSDDARTGKGQSSAAQPQCNPEGLVTQV